MKIRIIHTEGHDGEYRAMPAIEVDAGDAWCLQVGFIASVVHSGFGLRWYGAKPKPGGFVYGGVWGVSRDWKPRAGFVWLPIRFREFDKRPVFGGLKRVRFR